jgi:L-alanine-DL-glutamate epimerase-like enolase superfamily enzyme
VEITVWDLLGRTANKPVFELLGQKVRSSYDVYLSSFDRESPPEKVLEELKQKLYQTSAKEVTIKIGGRLRTTPEDDARSTKLLGMARKFWAIR